MTRELVMYTRRMGCPFVTVAKRVLDDYHVAYREILIDQDDTARQRVLRWTGFLSVPTLLIAETGSDMPVQDPVPLPVGSSPRGIHRGVMITEPSADQLTEWLTEHGFIAEP